MSLLNLKLDVESPLSHVPEEAYHNLCFAKIESVTVEFYEVKQFDDNGAPSASEYAGLTVPRLNIKTKREIMPFSVDTNQRSDTFSFGTINIKDTRTGQLRPKKDVTERVEQEFMHMIHIHNVIRKHTNQEPLDVSILSKYDPFAIVEDRVVQLGEIFEYIAKMFNTVLDDTKKEQYKDIVLCWALIPGGGQSRSKYVLPKYVGKGFVEVFKNQKFKPAISIPPNVIMRLGKLEETDVSQKGNTALNESSVAALNNLGLNFGPNQ